MRKLTSIAGTLAVAALFALTPAERRSGPLDAHLPFTALLSMATIVRVVVHR